jgi:superfamily II RNA helicase
MAGLVEAWALGTPWSTILGLTSLSEGDIIRLLRRVLDLLRQIPRLPYVPVSLSETTASRQREAK